MTIKNVPNLTGTLRRKILMGKTTDSGNREKIFNRVKEAIYHELKKLDFPSKSLEKKIEKIIKLLVDHFEDEAREDLIELCAKLIIKEINKQTVEEKNDDYSDLIKKLEKIEQERKDKFPEDQKCPPIKWPDSPKWPIEPNPWQKWPPLSPYKPGEFTEPNNWFLPKFGQNTGINPNLSFGNTPAYLQNYTITPYILT
jgi:predicted translin family RNA/ssDNA-binding protein